MFPSCSPSAPVKVSSLMPHFPYTSCLRVFVHPGMTFSFPGHLQFNHISSVKHPWFPPIGNDRVLLCIMTIYGCTWQEITDLTAANQKLLTPPPSLECMLHPSFPQWEPFQGCRMQRVRCCGDHLDSVPDGTLSRPLCELWGFWRAGAAICTSCPRQASCVSSLAC